PRLPRRVPADIRHNIARGSQDLSSSWPASRSKQNSFTPYRGVKVASGVTASTTPAIPSKLCGQGANDCLWFMLDDLQQDTGGTIRRAPADFPFLYRIRGEAKTMGKLDAGKRKSLADGAHIDFLRHMDDEPFRSLAAREGACLAHAGEDSLT